MIGLVNRAKSLLGMGGEDKSHADPDELSGQAEEFIEQRWNDLKTAYIIYHMSVWESLLFYAGQSWISWDENRKIWYPNTPTDEWVPRPKINRFSPTIDSISSNFNNIPTIEAIPANELNGDIRIHGIADISNALTRDFVKFNGLDGDFQSKEDKSGFASQLFVLAGSVFTEVYPEETDSATTPVMGQAELFAQTCQTCDFYAESVNPYDVCPNDGGPLKTEPVNRMQPQLNPADGSPMTQQEPRYCIKCDVKNPVHAFPRAGAGGMEATPFMVWAERMTLDYIWFKWEVEAEADYEFADGYSVTFEHALNYYYSGYSSSTLQGKDSCLVIRCFIEPGKVKDFPDGLWAVRINGKVVECSTWNEKFGEHPLTYGGYLQLPTVFFARSVAFDLVEIQREKQAYESLIKIHAMTCANSPIIIDENTVVDEITGRPDKVIKYRSIGPGSAPPKRLEHGTLDNGVYTMRQALHDEFENISGAVSVFRGKQPGSITAGNAIDKLQNQAEQMFSKPQQNWNSLWRETIRKGVKYAQSHYTHAQIAEIVGPDRATQIDDFKRADIDKILQFVVGGHSGQTKGERQQKLLMLFDRGALDISSAAVKQEIYECFGETGLMKLFNLDATRARFENQQMMQLQQVQPMPEVEDMGVHLQIHGEKIKSLEFERWPQPAKQLMLTHFMMTKQAQMMEQMAQAAVAQGPPKPPPGKPGSGAPPPEKHITPPEVKPS